MRADTPSKQCILQYIEVKQTKVYAIAENKVKIPNSGGSYLTGRPVYSVAFWLGFNKIKSNKESVVSEICASMAVLRHFQEHNMPCEFRVSEDSVSFVFFSSQMC